MKKAFTMKYRAIRKAKTDPAGTSCRKRAYFSMDEAQEAIDYIEETTWVKNLYAYKCNICGLWHLTSRKG